MITLMRKGTYRLLETKDKTKILFLDGDTYRWTSVNGIGEILVEPYQNAADDKDLCSGGFQLLDVKEETRLASTMHLELTAKAGQVQGYLLLTGLPSEKGSHKRIVPTIERASQSL